MGRGLGVEGCGPFLGTRRSLSRPQLAWGRRAEAPDPPSQGGPLPKLWAQDAHHPPDGAAVFPKPQWLDAAPPEQSPHAVPSVRPAWLPSTSVPAHPALRGAFGSDSSSPLTSPGKRPRPLPHVSASSAQRELLFLEHVPEVRTTLSPTWALRPVHPKQVPMNLEEAWLLSAP